MAQYVTNGAGGLVMKCASPPRSPGHSFGSPGLSFGNRGEVPRSGKFSHCGKSATRVRATLVVATHFDALGVGHNASKSEIKNAYKKLAKQFHPDVCRGDQSQMKFIQIRNAYETALNCVIGSDPASSNCDAENYAEDCREELEEWEEFMGFEGAGGLHY